MEIAGAVAGGVSRAVGAAGDAALSLGDVVAGHMEEGLGDVTDAAGDAVGGIAGSLGGLGEAFANRRRLRMDLNHNVKLFPDWLLYACSFGGVVSFLAAYGRTLFCCYWPLVCCGGCVARIWNRCFRKFACPCTNDFMFLTVTIHRIVSRQTLRQWSPQQRCPRNLRVGVEYGAFCARGAFSEWKTLKCAAGPLQPLEAEPKQLNGETVYFEATQSGLGTRRSQCGAQSSLHEENLFLPKLGGEGDVGQAPSSTWVATRPLRATRGGMRDRVPAGWALQCVRWWDPEQRTWKCCFDDSEDTDPNSALARLQSSRRETRLEFRGCREGAAEWPSRGVAADALTLSHWGEDEDLVLVVQVLVHRDVLAQAARHERQRNEGTHTGMLHSAFRSVATSTSSLLSGATAVVGRAFGKEDEYEMVRAVTAEIRPSHLETGTQHHTFKGRHLVHVWLQTASSRARNAVVIRLKRIRVEVAPGQGPLRGKVKFVAFAVPRQAFMRVGHAQSLDVGAGEVSRTDIYQVQGSTRLSIPLRPMDTEALVHIRPEQTYGQRLSSGLRAVPLAGSTLASAVEWATGVGAKDELYSGTMRLKILPQADGSNVLCQVGDEPPVEITETEMAPPGTVTQVMEVTAASATGNSCSYGLEFRLQASTVSEDFGVAFPAKAPTRIGFAWVLFLASLTFSAMALAVILLGKNFWFYNAIDSMVPDKAGVQDVVLPGGAVLPLSDLYSGHSPKHHANVTEDEVPDALDGIIDFQRHWVRAVIEALNHGTSHRFETALPLLVSGGFMFLLALVMCASGNPCPCLPKAVNQCLSLLTWVGALLAIVGSVVIVVIACMALLLSGHWHDAATPAKVVGVLVVVIPVLLSFCACWGCIRYLKGIMREGSRKRDAMEKLTVLTLPLDLAKELNLIQQHGKSQKVGETMMQAAADAVDFGGTLCCMMATTDISGMARLNKSLLEAPEVQLPLLVLRGTAWMDTRGTFYADEKLSTAFSRDSMNFPAFQRALRQLHDRGAGVTKLGFQSEKLFNALVDRGAADPLKRSQGSEKGQPCAEKFEGIFDERLLTLDAFRRVWKAVPQDENVQQLRIGLSTFFHDGIDSPDEAWQKLQMTGVVGYLVYAWKTNTPAVIGSGRKGSTFQDPPQQPGRFGAGAEEAPSQVLVVEVDLIDVEESVLQNAKLHGMLHLRFLGKDLGSLALESPRVPMRSALVGLAGRRKLEVRLRDPTLDGRRLKFDEYAINFWLTPCGLGQDAFKMNCWRQDYFMSLKNARIAWSMYVDRGEGRPKRFTTLTSGASKHTQFERVTESDLMLRWFLPTEQARQEHHTQTEQDMDTTGETTDDNEETPLSKSYGPETATVRRRTHWWPVSEYRRILRQLGDHSEKNSEIGMVAIDIVPNLGTFLAALERGETNSDSSVDQGRWLSLLSSSESADRLGHICVEMHAHTLLKQYKGGSSSFAHEFHRYFDSRCGWKAKVAMRKLPLPLSEVLSPMRRSEATPWKEPNRAACADRVVAGWGLEKMTFGDDQLYETPWTVKEGGDPIAWLKRLTADHPHATVKLIGRRRLVLDAHGFVHELVSTAGSSLQDVHDGDEPQGMPAMELQHMLQVLLGKLQQDSDEEKAHAVVHQLPVPLRSRADVAVLQKAVGTCTHNYLNRMRGRDHCNAMMELSSDGAALPCGAKFLKATSMDPSKESITDLDTLVKEAEKHHGHGFLPAVAHVTFTHERLRHVPGAHTQQLMHHFAMVAKVHDFEVGLADSRRALLHMAGPRSLPAQQQEVLKFLVSGEPWPLQVHCPCNRGEPMAYSTPRFPLFSSRCLGCPDKASSDRRMYRCSKCHGALCEGCVVRLNDFKGELRLLNLGVVDEDDDDLDADEVSGPAGELVRDKSNATVRTSTTHSSEMVRQIESKCCDWDKSHTTMRLDEGQLQELADFVSGPRSKLEEYLKTFMPVENWPRRPAGKCAEPAASSPERQAPGERAACPSCAGGQLAAPRKRAGRLPLCGGATRCSGCRQGGGNHACCENCDRHFCQRCFQAAVHGDREEAEAAVADSTSGVAPVSQAASRSSRTARVS